MDLAQFVPDDAPEEGVGFDLSGAVFTAGSAEAVVDVAEESCDMSAENRIERVNRRGERRGRTV